MRMKKVTPFIVMALVAYFGWTELDLSNNIAPQTNNEGTLTSEAFKQRLSDVQVEGSGEVVKLLPDDNDGSRHQRFILRLSSGQTVLIAYNIDLAPRISEINDGDVVAFNGEYEWNDRGGVVHWTHRDPDGDHPHGWLMSNAKRYE
jgi:hypothetical protein